MSLPRSSIEVLAKFSGEEGLGRYLDLNSLYERYLNLKNVERPERGYLDWLESFDETERIPKSSKNNDYLQYVLAALESVHAIDESQTGILRRSSRT